MRLVLMQYLKVLLAAVSFKTNYVLLKTNEEISDNNFI